MAPDTERRGWLQRMLPQSFRQALPKPLSKVLPKRVSKVLPAQVTSLSLRRALILLPIALLLLSDAYRLIYKPSLRRYKRVRRWLRAPTPAPPPPNLALSEECFSAEEMLPNCTEANVNVWASTNVRDENNIVEWIAYHLLIGFERILIVDDGSEQPVREQLAAAGMLADGLIEVGSTNDPRFDIPPRLKKLAIMQHISRAWASDGGATWFIHLDSDEYINLRGHWPGGVSQLMSCYEGFSAVPARWELFGFSGHDHHPWGQLIIEAYTRAQSLSNADWWQRDYPQLRFDPGPGFNVGFLTKMFIRPELASFALTPHSWSMLKGSPPGITPSTRREWAQGPWLPYELACGEDEVVTVNHYAVQDLETFKARKINRPRDDDGAMRDSLVEMANDEKMLKDWTEGVYNDVDDTSLAQMAPKVHLLIRCAHNASRHRKGAFPDATNLSGLPIASRAAACSELVDELPHLAGILGKAGRA